VKPLPTGPISFEEFLDWCDEDTRAEWVKGRVVLMSPASGPHQRIGSFLEVLLHLYVQKHGLGEIWRAPFRMKLASIPSAREPDLLFIAQRRWILVEHTYVDGPADLAVEIISPESVDRDRVEKFQEYQAVGIREYWLIDPEKQKAEFYSLRKNGKYTLVPLAEDGKFHSTVISGFSLRVEWLWQTPLLRTEDVLRELGVF
jgi:Uma2 family endonuclease